MSTPNLLLKGFCFLMMFHKCPFFSIVNLLMVYLFISKEDLMQCGCDIDIVYAIVAIRANGMELLY